MGAVPSAQASGRCAKGELGATEHATALQKPLATGLAQATQFSSDASARVEGAQSPAEVEEASDKSIEEDDEDLLTVRVVCESKDDGSLREKIFEKLHFQGLSPLEWRAVGGVVCTDAEGRITNGRPDWDTVTFPLTVEVIMAYAGQGGNEAPLDSTNPFDTHEYSAAVMTESEIESLTVPFADVSERLRATLEEHGAAIVTGVIDDEELQALESDFGQDLAELVDEEALNEAGPEADSARLAYEEFRAQGPRAFPLADVKRLTAAAGFSVSRCLSQGRFAWRVRRHPHVQAVYQAIYPDAEALVGSMDVTFFTPQGQPMAEKNKFSAHVDQNSNDVRPGLADCESFQGVLYVWPSTADGHSSTTVVWPGSHRTVWPEMMKDPSFLSSGEAGFHYSEISEMQSAGAARNLAEGWVQHARRAVVPRGALFLWNSRTVHTGWSGGPRLAQTVCFEPAARRPERERLSKLRLAALGLPSTHWASAGMQHDIILGDPGYAAVAKPRSRTAKGLPLRPAIRPAGLTEAADLEALEKLVNVDYTLTGMWEAPEELSELLESSVREEFKEYL